MRGLGFAADNRGTVSEHGLHRIDDELREDWIDSWFTQGLAEVETYLGKHAAFDAFLEDRE
jgi:hypothetical protein